MSLTASQQLRSQIQGLQTLSAHVHTLQRYSSDLGVSLYKFAPLESEIKNATAVLEKKVQALGSVAALQKEFNLQAVRIKELSDKQKSLTQKSTELGDYTLNSYVADTNDSLASLKLDFNSSIERVNVLR